MRLKIAIGITAAAVLLAVVWWRPILALGAIGLAYLTTTHSFLIWYGLAGAILLLLLTVGILREIRRK